MFSRKTVLLVIMLCLLAAPLSIAYAAGGAITGVVTDPKGAVIVGATVTVIDPDTAQTYLATTDKDGRYKIEKLPAGSYVLTITARGFADARRENINVQEDKSTTLDLKLEVGAVEETVNVSAGAAKGNTDSVYQRLRQNSTDANAFSGPFATVSNLVLKRDAATYTLRSGEVYFSPAVEGHRTGAVFIGEGELTMTPPTEAEKRQLTVFIDKPTLTEEFTRLILHFTDQTFDEIKASPNVHMGENGAQAARARDLYRENESYVRKELRNNLELRTLTDIYATVHRPGFFIAFINGRHYSKLVYQVDPLGTFLFAPEQVLLINYDPNDFGFWSSFHMAEEYRRGTATSSQNRRLYDVKHHEIDGLLRGSRITVTDEVTLHVNVSGTRVLPFNLLPSLRVTGVRDEQGHDLDFIQESKNEDADFAVILPTALSAGSSYKLSIQYKAKAR